MLDRINEARKKSRYSGSGAITREQFLFYEMRTIAKLVQENLTEQEILQKVYQDNLFQYPTERSIKTIANGCMRRLKALDNNILINAIANQPSDISKQICLYAMMKQYNLVLDFMVMVIGEKYRQNDLSFGKTDVNVFLLRLQEQDDYIALWSSATLAKIRQVIMKTLVETEYIDTPNAVRLNPVLLSRVLEDGIRENHDEGIFPAFNFFE